MKVIDLGNRVIFVDDIVYIFNDYKCGEYANYYSYYIVTKYEKIPISEHYYKIVKEYLLSLNDVTKDDTIEDIELNYGGQVKNISEKIEKISLDDYVEFTTSGDMQRIDYMFNKNTSTFVDKINEIIDKINGGKK